jgi:hypothetical protein
MQKSTSASSPEGSVRRTLFSRRTPADAETQHPAMTSLERAIDERLEEGLRAIEEQAGALMREIATEMWRASGRDTSEIQERILSFLSRDQSIRSLIMSSDERFQTLTVRTTRFEDILDDVAESSRATREAIRESAAVIHRVAESPAVHGVESVRNQLELVEHHIAAAFQHLDERDRALFEGIQSRIQAHGELITRETTRFVEAIQAYVQSGTGAAAPLASTDEADALPGTDRDESTSERVRGAIHEAMNEVAEGVELSTERIGIEQRETAAALERMQRTWEARVHGLGQLVRSDSEALRRHIERVAREQEHRLSAEIETHVSALARAAEEQVSALTMAVSAMVERHLAGFSSETEERLAAITSVVASDAERSSSVSEAVESMKPALEDTRVALERRVVEHVDDQIASLAKLIRSDNRAIAEALSRDPGGESETAKQTLRAVKELHASLSGDVDRRFQEMAENLHRESQSTVETMAKVAEVLADRIERLSAKVDSGFGSDLQVAVERMGDAISAISGLSRRP